MKLKKILDVRIKEVKSNIISFIKIEPIYNIEVLTKFLCFKPSWKPFIARRCYNCEEKPVFFVTLKKAKEYIIKLKELVKEE